MRKPFNASFISRTASMLCGVLVALGCSVFVMPSAFAKDLIVYLSRSHNTEAVARMIQTETGGELVALELQKPYPENYRATVAQVQMEDESGYLPPLRTRIDNLQQFNRVFIGFPTWGMQLPPPIRSFLASHDLKGKTVAPFKTHAGYGVGSGFEEINRLCKGCRVTPGLSLQGGRERDGILFVMEGTKAEESRAQVRQWLSRLK